jgi:methyltransferase FkbM-like protein
MRSALMRPGRIRRVPFGLARGLWLEVDQGSTLHVYLGTAELEVARHLRRFAQPGYRIFDVGSNNGYYALALSRRTGAEAAAFDFADRELQRIRRNVARNPPLDRLVSVVPAYVCATVDPAQRADTLDRLAGRLFVPDVLKIDVEGGEVEVLAGAQGILADRRPHVVVETHGRELERACAQVLAGHGYRPVVVSQRRVLREGRPNPDNRWLVAAGRDRST